MSTHSGIQLILIGLFLLGGFAAVLTALLRRNRNPRAVPALVAVVAFLFLCLGSVVMVLVQTMQNSGMVLFALLILTAVVMLCGMVWFLLGHVREMNKTILALLMTYLLVVLFEASCEHRGGAVCDSAVPSGAAQHLRHHGAGAVSCAENAGYGCLAASTAECGPLCAAGCPVAPAAPQSALCLVGAAGRGGSLHDDRDDTAGIGGGSV